MKNSIISFLILIMLFFGVFFSTTQTTKSMCVYDLIVSAPYCLNGIGAAGCKAIAKLNCGLFCSYNRFLDQNARKCAAGKGGHLRGCTLNNQGDVDSYDKLKFLYCTAISPSDTMCYHKVEKHGWVDIEKTCLNPLEADIDCKVRK